MEEIKKIKERIKEKIRKKIEREEIRKLEEEKERLEKENRELKMKIKMIEEDTRINEDRANEIYAIAVINGNEKIRSYAREIMIDQYKLGKELRNNERV